MARILRLCLVVCLLPRALAAQQLVAQHPPPSAPLAAPPWVEMFDQGQTDPKLQGLRTPRGVKLEIVAEQPAVAAPRQLAFGDDGTLYYLQWQPGELQTESRNLETSDGRSIKRTRTVKSTRDRLCKLHDGNGDGVYEESRVVMSDLELPSGLLLHDGWFYWTSGGRVLRRRPFAAELAKELAAAHAGRRGPATVATSDGKWLEQELLSGLAGELPFQASGLSLDDGGWLYVTSGSGDHRAQSWDGSQATVLKSGAVFRMRQGGSQVSEFARGLCQPPCGLAFDGLGNPLVTDGDWGDGKLAGGRLLHLWEGGDYGWQHAADKFSVPDPLRAAAAGERPGTLPPMLRGSTAKSMSITFAHLPDTALVACDADGHAVRAFSLRPLPVTLEPTAMFALLESDDPLFRPCAAVHGPDGALYVADWRGAGDFATGGSGDGKAGRIYRLSWLGWKDRPAAPLAPRDRWAKLQELNDEQLTAELSSADLEVRRRAAQQLVIRAQRDAAVRTRLLAVLADETVPAGVRAAAIGVLSHLLDQPLRLELSKLLHQPSADVARLAADVLASTPPTKEEELAALADELKTALSVTADPAKQRPLQLALGKLAAVVKSIDLAEWNFEAMSVTHRPTTSRYVFDAHVRALELTPGAAKELMLGNLDVALNLPEADPLERQRLKQFVALTAEAMRTRELADFLDSMLRGEENLFVRLDAPLEARLLACYRNVLADPPITADAVVEWIEKNPGGPVEVEVAALETLSLVGVTREGAIDKLADRLLTKPADAVLVAKSLLAGRLDASLRPKIKAALTKHGQSKATEDISGLLRSLGD